MNAVPPLSRLGLCACMLAVLCSIAACGLKGPLYMPDQKPDMVEVKVPPGVPTPSSEKKERTDSSKPASGSTQPAPTPPPR